MSFSMDKEVFKNSIIKLTQYPDFPYLFLTLNNEAWVRDTLASILFNEFKHMNGIVMREQLTFDLSIRDSTKAIRVLMEIKVADAESIIQTMTGKLGTINAVRSDLEKMLKYQASNRNVTDIFGLLIQREVQADNCLYVYPYYHGKKYGGNQEKWRVKIKKNPSYRDNALLIIREKLDELLQELQLQNEHLNFHPLEFIEMGKGHLDDVQVQLGCWLFHIQTKV